MNDTQKLALPAGTQASATAFQDKSTGIDKAMRLAGGGVPLGQKLGVTHQAIYSWCKRGWVPTERAMQIASMFGIPHVELLSPRLVALIDLNRSSSKSNEAGNLS